MQAMIQLQLAYFFLFENQFPIFDGVSSKVNQPYNKTFQASNHFQILKNIHTYQFMRFKLSERIFNHITNDRASFIARTFNQNCAYALIYLPRYTQS